MNPMLEPLTEMLFSGSRTQQVGAAFGLAAHIDQSKNNMNGGSADAKQQHASSRRQLFGSHAEHSERIRDATFENAAVIAKGAIRMLKQYQQPSEVAPVRKHEVRCIVVVLI
jgi:hypothetical protein